jgi:hypothetical protein
VHLAKSEVWQPPHLALPGAPPLSAKVSNKMALYQYWKVIYYWIGSAKKYIILEIL